MDKEVRRFKKLHLALAIAEGESIAEWAQQNGVSERTAFYWAKDPKVRREVDACRRRALNQAVGRLTGMAMNAVDGIAHLAKVAISLPALPWIWPIRGRRFASRWLWPETCRCRLAPRPMAHARVRPGAPRPL